MYTQMNRLDNKSAIQLQGHFPQCTLNSTVDAPNETHLVVVFQQYIRLRARLEVSIYKALLLINAFCL